MRRKKNPKSQSPLIIHFPFAKMAAVAPESEINEQVSDVANASISAEETHADAKTVAEDTKDEGLFHI